MGDFNLNADMDLRPDYDHRNLLEQLSAFCLTNNLTQHVNFKTWSRIINGIKKESLLDHVYSNAPAYVKDIGFIEPTFGDRPSS